MDKFSFWQRWLQYCGILITLFGISIAFLNSTPLFYFFDLSIDPVFWKNTIIPENFILFKQWIYGVLGATMSGWGFFLSFIARFAFKKKEIWSWYCLSSGLIIWFIIDTYLSVVYCVFFNVIFNTILFIVISLPIIFSKKYFNNK